MLIQTYEGKSITEWALACKELQTQLQHCREERQKLTTAQVDAVNELIEPIQRTVQTRVDVLERELTAKTLEHRLAEAEAERKAMEENCSWKTMQGFIAQRDEARAKIKELEATVRKLEQENFSQKELLVQCAVSIKGYKACQEQVKELKAAVEAREKQYLLEVGELCEKAENLRLALQRAGELVCCLTTERDKAEHANAQLREALKQAIEMVNDDTCSLDTIEKHLQQAQRLLGEEPGKGEAI